MEKPLVEAFGVDDPLEIHKDDESGEYELNSLEEPDGSDDSMDSARELSNSTIEPNADPKEEKKTEGKREIITEDSIVGKPGPQLPEKSEPPAVKNKPKKLKRHMEQETSNWHTLSRWCVSLDNPKSKTEKLAQKIYTGIFSSQNRAISKPENMAVWVVTARRLVAAYLHWATLFLFTFSLFLVTRQYVIASPGIQLGEHPAHRKPSSVAGLFEWHMLSGYNRAVPYCTQYDKAIEVFAEELLDESSAHGGHAHARCVLRPDKHAHSIGVNYEKLASLPTLVDIMQKNGGYAMAAKGVDMQPHVYVLRNWTRYLRLSIRSGEGGIVHRMVQEQDILDLLDQWHADIDRKLLGARVHYCMSPAYLGIVDDIAFYYNGATKKWEIWHRPEVIRVQEMSARKKSRVVYSPDLSKFPYVQNTRMLQALEDWTGNNHSVIHHDGITVRFMDSSTVRLPEDLDPRERMWVRHSHHDPEIPFALAVPLAEPHHYVERILTGADTGCFYSNLHISDIIKRTR